MISQMPKGQKTPGDCHLSSYKISWQALYVFANIQGSFFVKKSEKDHFHVQST
jgi:hypothetical protein